MKIKETIPRIYLICGRARHGKDEIAKAIQEYYYNLEMDTMNLRYAHYIKEYAKNITDWDGREETKPRALLQMLGTDIIRKRIDNDLFIKRMIDDVAVYGYFFDVITVSDGRFVDEVVKLKEAYPNTVVIHVYRPNFESGLKKEELAHATEHGLDHFHDYDYEILNDGTLEDLRKKVFDILERIEK